MNKIKLYISRKLRSLNITRHRLFGIEIGKDVFISWGAKIDTAYRGTIELKDRSFISNGAKIMAHDHAIYNIAERVHDDGKGRVIVGTNVVVGVNAVILRNVTIGENAIIAAGAIVTKDVPPNTIVAGVPAQIIKRFTPARDTQVNDD